MKTKFWNLLVFCTLLFPLAVFSQGVSISGNVGTMPDPSAMLDIQSASMGLLIPRLSSTEREAINNPADGLMVYDSTAQRFYTYYKKHSVWKPLAMSEEVLWLYDSTLNKAYLVINDSLRIGIGTTEPEVALDVVGSIRASHNLSAGSNCSVNFKLNEVGDTIPGVFRNPLAEWSDFDPFLPQSRQIIAEKDGHDSVAYFISKPSQGGGNGPGDNFFVLTQGFSQDSLDAELWAFLESPGFLFGLIKFGVGSEEPSWVAAITPMFDDNIGGIGELYAQYDIIAGYDTSFNSIPIGLPALHTWNHYRLSWKYDEYFKIWLNGTLIANLPGSNIAPEQLVVGGYDSLYLDAIGLSTNGYLPSTNLGTGKSMARVGVFDAIIAKNLPGIHGYLPLSGGTMSGGILIKPPYKSSSDFQSYSRSEIALTSVDSLNNNRGRLGFSSETNSSYYGYHSYERIYAEGDLEIVGNSGIISLAFDSVGFEGPYNARYRAEFTGGARGWGYGSNDRAGFSIGINYYDTISINNPLTITGFRRENPADSDSISISFTSAPDEEYVLWKGKRILMTSGYSTSTYGIDTVYIDGDNVWLIIEGWFNSDIQNLTIGDQFIVMNPQMKSITSNSYYVDSLNKFQQSINSSDDLFIGAQGKLVLDAMDNDIKIGGKNINFLHSSVVFIDNPGSGVNVGIGTSNPEEKLSISDGCMQIGSYSPTTTVNRLYNYSSDLYWNGSKVMLANKSYSSYSGDFFKNADEQFKTNIRPVVNGLDLVLEMNPVVFEWKDQPDKIHFGLIAQDVSTLLPQEKFALVREGDYSDQQLGIDYTEIIPLLIRSVQELKHENTELRNEIRGLKKEIESLK